MTARTTEYRYNVDGLLEELVCWNGEEGEQVTRWEYGTELADDGSGIARADLARAKVYPDHGRVSYGYNRLAELTRMDDPNGTVHEYGYDAVNRLTSDRVAALDTAKLDGAVRAIRVSYFARGEIEKVTSYNSPTATGTGNVVNEVLYAYNGFGQEVTEWQSHAGVVVTSGSLESPLVAYDYEDGSGNTIRRTETTYPNGQVFGLAYEGELDTAFDRVTKIQHAGGATADLAIYSRLGMNTVVRRAQLNGLEMTAIVPSGQATGDAGDIYIGYDRFGRLEDARWIRTSSGAGRERVEYGFDRVGNRVWRRNREAPSELFDEAYRYDGLYQIKALDRGKLNQNRSAVGGVPVKGERWEYDAMGNWLEYGTVEGGEPGVERTGVYNAANELLFLSGANTHLSYDAVGNMTKTPQPGNMSAGYLLKWDAWNRLVEVANAASVPLGKYAYDGLTRRISKQTGFPSAVVTRHYYYSDRWQVLEERLDSSTNADRLFVWGLQGVDDLICRDELDTSTGIVTRRLWALNDGKNVTAIALGNDVVERYAYDAFGMPELLKVDFTPKSPSDPDYGWETLFCGYRWDREAMLYQVRYRYYHPDLGRWLSSDPIEEDGSLQTYAYADDNPLTRRDPFGLQSSSVTSANDCSKRKCRKRVNVASPDSAGRCADRDRMTSGGTPNAAKLSSHIGNKLGDCDCVAELSFAGHGNPDGFHLDVQGSKAVLNDDKNLGANWITKRNAYEVFKAIARANCFCKPCVIKIQSCNIGLGPVPSLIASATRCTVVAAAGYCYSNIYSSGEVVEEVPDNQDSQGNPDPLERYPGAHAGYNTFYPVRFRKPKPQLCE